MDLKGTSGKTRKGNIIKSFKTQYPKLYASDNEEEKDDVRKPEESPLKKRAVNQEERAEIIEPLEIQNDTERNDTGGQLAIIAAQTPQPRPQGSREVVLLGDRGDDDDDDDETRQTGGLQIQVIDDDEDNGKAFLYPNASDAGPSETANEASGALVPRAAGDLIDGLSVSDEKQGALVVAGSVPQAEYDLAVAGSVSQNEYDLAVDKLRENKELLKEERNKVSKQNEALTTLKNALTEASKQIKNLKQKVDGAQGEKDEAVNPLKQQIATLKLDKSTQAAEIMRLKAELKNEDRDLKQKHEEAMRKKDKKIEDLQHDIKQLKETHGNEKTKQKDALANEKKENSKLKKEIQGLNKEVNNLKKEVTSKVNEYKKLQKSLTARTNDADVLEREISQVVNALSLMQVTNDGLPPEAKGLMDTIGKKPSLKSRMDEIRREEEAINSRRRAEAKKKTQGRLSTLDRRIKEANDLSDWEALIGDVIKGVDSNGGLSSGTSARLCVQKLRRARYYLHQHQAGTSAGEKPFMQVIKEAKIDADEDTDETSDGKTLLGDEFLNNKADALLAKDDEKIPLESSLLRTALPTDEVVTLGQMDAEVATTSGILHRSAMELSRANRELSEKTTKILRGIEDKEKAELEEIDQEIESRRVDYTNGLIVIDPQIEEDDSMNEEQKNEASFDVFMQDKKDRKDEVKRKYNQVRSLTMKMLSDESSKLGLEEVKAMESQRNSMEALGQSLRAQSVKQSNTQRKLVDSYLKLVDKNRSDSSKAMAEAFTRQQQAIQERNNALKDRVATQERVQSVLAKQRLLNENSLKDMMSLYRQIQEGALIVEAARDKDAVERSLRDLQDIANVTKQDSKIAEAARKQSRDLNKSLRELSQKYQEVANERDDLSIQLEGQKDYIANLKALAGVSDNPGKALVADYNSVDRLTLIPDLTSLVRLMTSKGSTVLSDVKDLTAVAQATQGSLQKIRNTSPDAGGVWDKVADEASTYQRGGGKTPQLRGARLLLLWLKRSLVTLLVGVGTGMEGIGLEEGQALSSQTAEALQKALSYLPAPLPPALPRGQAPSAASSSKRSLPPSSGQRGLALLRPRLFSPGENALIANVNARLYARHMTAKGLGDLSQYLQNATYAELISMSLFMQDEMHKMAQRQILNYVSFPAQELPEVMGYDLKLNSARAPALLEDINTLLYRSIDMQRHFVFPALWHDYVLVYVDVQKAGWDMFLDGVGRQIRDLQVRSGATLSLIMVSRNLTPEVYTTYVSRPNRANLAWMSPDSYVLPFIIDPTSDEDQSFLHLYVTLFRLMGSCEYATQQQIALNGRGVLWNGRGTRGIQAYLTPRGSSRTAVRPFFEKGLPGRSAMMLGLTNMYLQLWATYQKLSDQLVEGRKTAHWSDLNAVPDIDPAGEVQLAGTLNFVLKT